MKKKRESLFCLEDLPNIGPAVAQGRGWAVLRGDELHGMIFFHGGDDSEFVAKRLKEHSKAKKAKR